MGPIALGIAIELGAKLSDVTAQKVMSIFNEKAETDINLQDILNQPGGQDALRIALHYFKKNEGVPNEKAFKILKAILKKLWKESDDKARESYQYFAEILSNLSLIELHILITAFKVSKSNEIQYTHNFHDWCEQILKKSTIGFRELIDNAVPILQEKKLVMNVTHGDFQKDGGSDYKNNLTSLGYSIFESVYDEINEALV